MKNYWLLGAAALVFAACTSNDDFSSGKVEANLTSSSDYAFVKSNNGRIVNFSDLETPGTRAVSSAVINLLGVTSTMPEAPAVPSDAKSMVGVNGWEVQSGAKYFITHHGTGFVPAKAVKQHLKYLKKVKALRAKASSPEELAAAIKKAFPKRGGAENLAEVAANLFK